MAAAKWEASIGLQAAAAEQLSTHSFAHVRQLGTYSSRSEATSNYITYLLGSYGPTHSTHPIHGREACAFLTFLPCLVLLAGYSW